MRQVLLTIVLASSVFQMQIVAQSSEPATYRLTGSRIAIGQDVRIERDEEVSDSVVVVAGSATIDGRVRDGLVVVGGDAHLGPNSDVQGDIVMVGGRLTRDVGARQLGRVNYVSFGDWSGRSAWWFPRVDLGELGRWLSLAGTMARVSVLAVLMAAMLLVARAPVARVGRAAIAEPARAFIVGLAAEVFFVPMLVATSLAMAITIVGLPFVALLVPVAIVVAVFALVLGYTALACRLGEWLEDRFGWHPGNAFLATGVGFLLIIGPTLLARVLGVAPEPLRLAAFALLVAGLALEFLVWTLGLGAAIMTGLGRWHRTPPPLAIEG